MRRYRKNEDVYDEWGNHAGESRLSVGNVSGISSKLVWWFLGIVATASLAEASWLGNAVVDLKSQVAALNAKVDFLIADRRNGKP